MRNKRGILWTHYTLLMVAVMILPGCKALINHFAFLPDRHDLLPAERLPAGVEDVYVVTEDGVRIHGLYLPAAASRRLLLYFPGNAGNIYHRLPGLMRLRDAGISVLGVGYRGYGRSEGSPSEQGIYADGEAMYRYVTGALGVPDADLVFFGRSIGTTVAVKLAQDKTIAGVILVTPLTNAREQAKVSGLGLLAPLAGNAFDNLSRIDKVKVPVRVVHGTADRIIPFSMGKTLYDRVPNKAGLIAIQGGGHNDLQDRFAADYWPPIIDFVKRGN